MVNKASLLKNCAVKSKQCSQFIERYRVDQTKINHTPFPNLILPRRKCICFSNSTIEKRATPMPIMRIQSKTEAIKET